MSDDDSNIPPLSEEEHRLALQADDPKSIEETKQLTSGKSLETLKNEADAKEAARTERFRDHFEDLAIVTLYLVWLVFIVIGGSWAYHLITPPSWWWLDNEQVRHLQAIVTGGVLAGIAGGRLRKRLE